MPKLESRVQKFVDKQEPNAASSGGFVVIEEPQVLGTLAEVREEEGQYGTQWCVVWDKLVSLAGKEYPGRLMMWLNIPGGSKAPKDWVPYKNGQPDETLSAAERQDRWTEQIQKQGARLNALFAIPGYTTDSDTDEMIGDAVYLLDIGTRPMKDDPKRKRNVVFGFRSPKDATDDGGFDGGDADAGTDSGDDEF